MPYCCAAKSIAKDSGATHRAVECVIPMLAVGQLSNSGYNNDDNDTSNWIQNLSKTNN